ncbi:MAG: glycosyltransferase family 4 protein [Thermoleophilia bacterium]|nr:glycosyltransferase family 4 protein [Thermoleophilia bacterium]
MRVLYVSQYFVSANQPGGVRHWQHTRALAQAGHEVSVVTSYVQHKERTIPERYAGRRIVRETEDGLDMWRVYSTPGYGRDLRSRLGNYASFAWWASVAMTRVPKPKVVVASSPSLPAAGAAAVLAMVRRAPFVLEIRDLWPDSAVTMGLVNDRATIAAATRLERFCYRRADRIIALTEGIRDGIIAKGVPERKVTLITNGVDLDEAGGEQAPAAIPGVPDDAVVAMYVGNHGTYSSLGTVLEAADLLRGRPEIRVVLVGGGDQKARLVEQAARMELPNVVFADSVPKREVPAVIARADVCLLPYQDRDLFAGALPNKVFDYMAAARPILASAPEGELTRLIREAGCGVCTPPEDARAMADAIAALADDPGRKAMGRRGLAVALDRYDRRVLAKRFVGVVESAA